MAKPFIKPVISPEEAAALVKPGASLMVGGFNYGGAPYTLIDALCAAGTRDINLICVDTSWYNDKEPEPVGVARLVVGGQLGSLVASHIGLNRRTQELYTKGELMVELIPMGTFVERIRAGHDRARRAALHRRARADRRRRLHKGARRGRGRKPYLLRHKQELQPDDGDGGENRRRGGRRDKAARRDSPGRGRDAGHIRRRARDEKGGRLCFQNLAKARPARA